MDTKPSGNLNRRRFLTTTAAATVASVAAPAIMVASKTGSDTIIGSGDYRYRVVHGWPQLPDKFQWQTTHNVAVDKEGFLYVIHQGSIEGPDHPTIFVFDEDGKYVRSFGDQFRGGGHGIEVHEEDGQEFLYVCAYKEIKTFAKLDLKGEPVWVRRAPMEAGVYAEGEDTKPENTWGRDRFLPTNVAFLPDGDLLLADGYGSYFIHLYDTDGNWKSCFGGPGDGAGTFNTPHGMWIDQRGDEPQLVVMDRAHHTLQYLTLKGKHKRTQEGFGLPANADIYGDLMVIPELLARLTLLGRDGQVVAQLGDDTERIGADEKFDIRKDASRWQNGRFVHPHDACFDRDGNIFVAEWVGTGRVSKLIRLA